MRDCLVSPTCNDLWVVVGIIVALLLDVAIVIGVWMLAKGYSWSCNPLLYLVLILIVLSGIILIARARRERRLRSK